MRYLIPLFILICGFTFSKAQNLVPNPGFETNTGCPSTSCQFNLVTSWFTPNSNASGCGGGNFGSPDYFNTCGSGFFTTPLTLNGNVNPASGNGMAGIATYLSFSTNFREYISVQLTNTLQSGRTYRVQLEYTNGLPSPSTSYGGDGTELGIHLTNGPLTQNGRRPIRLSPTFETTTPIFSTSWQTLSFLITPSTNLDHITVGNFNNDNNTTVQRFGIPSSSFSYAFYYIDNVSVEEINPLEVQVEILESTISHSSPEAFIYPNPAKESPFIQIKHAPERAIATLFNYQGKRIRASAKKEEEALQIYIGDLPKGTYFIRLEDGRLSKTLKLSIH